MLQQYEEEELRQQAEAAQQAQQAQREAEAARQAQHAQQAQQGGVAAGAAGDDGEPGSGGKGRRKKKKKKGGKGGDASEAAEGAELAAEAQEDSAEWQAVGKKGKKQQQQQQQAPPPGLQQAPVPVVPSGKRASSQQSQAAQPDAQPSQEQHAVQGRGRLRQEQPPPPPPPQQQREQREQHPQQQQQQPQREQQMSREAVAARQALQAQQQAAQQAQQQQLSHRQQQQQQRLDRELRPEAQAFAPLPLPRALQPGQQAQHAQQERQEPVGSPSAERRLSSDFGRRRSLSAEAPSFVPGLPAGRASGRASSALPQLPDSLEPSPAASPPPPTLPATPEPSAVPAATDDTSDLFALLGLGPTGPSPERPGGFGFEQQQDMLQPGQLAASQPLGLEPLGLGLGGVHHSLQHSGSAAALSGPSLFSQSFAAPLSHAADTLAGSTGLAVSAGFGASALQPPLGLAAAPAPAVDPDTMAAAARAAQLAGYARQPEPLQQHAALLHGQPPAALSGAGAGLFLQQPQQHGAVAAQHSAVGLQGPGGWGQPVPHSLATSPGDDEMDSMLLVSWRCCTV